MSLHPHQLIAKSDGTTVLAEQLLRGDEIPSIGGPVRITEITRVREQEWCEVFLSNRASLMVSRDHCFAYSETNPVSAKELTLNTLLAATPKAATVEGLV